MTTQTTNTDPVRTKKIQDIFKFLDKVTLKYKDESFVMSLQEYFEKNGDLTDRQYHALLNVYERV